jgi:hypothetical protein
MEVFSITDADVAFIIDCDAIISSQAPNPFDSLPDNKFSAVGLSPRIDPDGHLQWLGVGHEWTDKLLILPGVEYVPSDGWRYFNSGVMLAYKALHQEAMDLAFKICHIPNQMGWIEQTPIQYALKKLGCPVFYAPEEWNFIHPMTMGSNFLDMKSTGVYVYHGAGDPSRMDWLAKVRWQA